MAVPTLASRLVRGAERQGMAALGRLTPGQRALLTRRPVRDVARLVLVPALLLRFDPRHAHGMDATFELQLRHPGGDGHDPVSIRVRDGRCTVLPRAAEAPDAVLHARLDDLLALVTGQASVMAMLGDRRLEVSGDPFLFMRFPGLFGGLG